MRPRGDAEAERPGLARETPAVDRGVDVELLGPVGEPQRLGGQHPGGRRREVVLESPAG